MWQDICWFKYFETTQKNLHWWEAILLFKWWEDIHTVKYFKRTWKKPHWWEAIKLFTLWQDILSVQMLWKCKRNSYLGDSVVHIVTIHLPIEVLWNNMNELTLPLWDISCNTFSSWMASHQYESFHVSLDDFLYKCLVKMWTNEWLLASVILSCFFILLDSINVLLQCEQWNGFWPVWVISCCLKVLECANVLSQYEQLNGISVVWVLSCTFKVF